DHHLFTLSKHVISNRLHLACRPAIHLQHISPTPPAAAARKSLFWTLHQVTHILSHPRFIRLFYRPRTPSPNFCPKDTNELVLYLVVYDARRRPVLVVDIKGDRCVNAATACCRADKQMRQRFDAFAALPRLWGLSMLGTSLRVYVCDVATGEIEPPFTKAIGPPPNYSFDYGFLEGGWDIDILSQQGFAKMKEIV
ncbi:hypothetical protein OG21DRAFT_1563822, partial [Imleria badia]